jgi:Domain of unknown function (DU1801)
MASSSAATVKEYIASLPADRRKAVEKVRKVVRANLPPGYKEGMLYGMIGYYVPFTLLPDTYNGQPLGIAGIASQKGHLSLYLMCVYGSPHLRGWFEDGFRKAGKKLNMGKSCVRFKSADDLPLDLIGQAIAKVSVDEFIAIYRASREGLASSSRKRKTPVKAKAKAKPRARARA